MSDRKQGRCLVKLVTNCGQLKIALLQSIETVKFDVVRAGFSFKYFLFLPL